MSDLIRRQALIECITQWYEDMGVDVHGILNKQLARILKEKDVDDIRLDFHDMWTSIESLPSADAVEVIRCEECIFYMAMGENRAWGKCRIHDRTTQDIDYCSWAERRES